MRFLLLLLLLESLLPLLLPRPLLQLPAAKYHGPAVGTSLHKKLAAGAESNIFYNFINQFFTLLLLLLLDSHAAAATATAAALAAAAAPGSKTPWP